MSSVALYVPDKEVSAWVTETNPKEAREWLTSLPLADSGDAARDIYQALYTLNRLDVTPQTRLELMELYRSPVATVSSVLHSNFAGLALPLPEEMRQLAEFIRQLQMEMAIGYKCAIRDLQAVRIPWGKKSQLALAKERAVWYLGELLLRSYQVYMPQPVGVWREVHVLYRYAEEQGTLTQAVQVSEDEEAGTTTILQRYLQIVLLGLCNPYQLPQNECNHVHNFLGGHAQKATITQQLQMPDSVGHFLIDLSADAPPTPFPQEHSPEPSPDLRALNAIELARAVHGFIKRIEQGESPARFLGLGAELTDTGCRDILRRMIRSWGLTPKRQYSRTKIRGHLSLCTGVNALHFFSSGRKPFTPPDEAEHGARAEHQATPQRASTAGRDDTRKRSPKAESTAPKVPSIMPGVPRWLAEAKLSTPEVCPVDRWQLRDESARGLLLSREGEVGAHVRVGDVIGIQGANDTDVWHVGVVRWIKSPASGRVEMGVERIAPELKPAAVKPVSDAGRRYTQALLLPAMPVLQRPPTLLAARGMYEPGCDLYLAESDGIARVVRPLKLLERTASFDQFVFAEVSGEESSSPPQIGRQKGPDKR
ncbi:MAG: hypothetical protein ACE5NW_00635 [Acidiferrobacterales bacterium]